MRHSCMSLRARIRCRTELMASEPKADRTSGVGAKGLPSTSFSQAGQLGCVIHPAGDVLLHLRNQS